MGRRNRREEGRGREGEQEIAEEGRVGMRKREIKMRKGRVWEGRRGEEINGGGVREEKRAKY